MDTIKDMSKRAEHITRAILSIMACSNDYKERFYAEYWQLRNRLEKLEKMTEDYRAGKLDFTPTCSIRLLEEQVTYMRGYLHVLENRAACENIDLEFVGGTRA